LAIAANESTRAEADVAAVLKQNPQHPFALYLKALLEAKKQNYGQAEIALQTMPGVIDYPPAIYLLAVIEMSREKLGQAEEHVNRFLSRVPNDEAGTELLVTL